MTKNRIPAETAAKPQSALQVLDGLTLDGIDAEIAEVDAQIGELTKQREALQAARRLVDIRLNGKPERKKPVRKVKAAPTTAATAATVGGNGYTIPANRQQFSRGSVEERSLTNREKIRNYLQTNPRATVNLISVGAGVTHGSVGPTLLQHVDLFKKNNDGTWSLVNKSDN